MSAIFQLFQPEVEFNAEQQAEFLGTLNQIKAPYEDLKVRVTRAAQLALPIEQWQQLQALKAEVKALPSTDPRIEAIRDRFTHSFASKRIDQLVKENSALKQQMSEQIEKLSKELQENERVKIFDKWTKLGLDGALVERHFESIQWLFDTKILFSLLTFQNSPSQQADRHLDIRDDGLYLRRGDEWVNADELRQQIHVDPKTQRIVSKENPNEHWLYLGTTGLTKHDRFNCQDMPPVHTLSDEQMKELQAEAAHFYHDENPDPTPDEDKPCILQIASSPRRYTGMDDHPMMRGAAAHIPIHVVMRLIRDGQVYSFGFEMLPDQQDYVVGQLLPPKNLLATADAKLATLDYEETRQHQGRMTTTIPITLKEFEADLKAVNDMNKGPPKRFNYLAQACPSLFRVIADNSKIKVNTGMGLGDFLGAFFPRIEGIPVIGDIIRPISRFFRKVSQLVSEAMPECIKKAFKAIADIVFYIPRKIGTIFLNLIILAAGGGKAAPGASSVSPEEDSRDNRHHLTRFSTLFRHWTDIFDDNLSKIEHNLGILDWQLKQKTTHVHPPKKQPEFTFLSSQIEDKEKSAEIKEYFHKKYALWQEALPLKTPDIEV